MKKGILWLHKWLGILTGIVIVVVSLTGCLYTFQDELKLWVYPHKYYIAEQQGTPLPISELTAIAESQLPQGEKVSRIDVYPAKNRTWIFRALDTDEDAFGHWNYYRYYKRVFLNPYTGELRSIENSKTEFFQVVLQLHMNLLLGKKVGHAVVGYSTAIFVLILISGLVLWWPKKWKSKKLKRSFWIDRKVKWKRLNYDLHNVVGFYSLLLALVLAITGLVFTFPSFKKGYTTFFNTVLPYSKPTKPQVLPTSPVNLSRATPLDNALHYTLTQHPDAGIMSIRLRKKTAPEIDIQVRMSEQRSGDFKWYYFDQKTVEINQVKSSTTLQGGDKLQALNFDLHTGNIGGMGTKILAFIVSLCCASLPITGYIIWWNKSRKKHRKGVSRKIQ
ncbi:PepSY domain-containing protein [Sphingobacterium psychroaquaticum]|nr:PepSY domain-containing protein [Sphingobacterium psychroaquaticum]